MGEKKVANGVVALSSAAVLAIYGAGYTRTRAAADRFAQQAAERRPHIPAPRGEAATPGLQLEPSVPSAIAPARDLSPTRTLAAEPTTERPIERSVRTDVPQPTPVTPAKKAAASAETTTAVNVTDAPGTSEAETAAAPASTSAVASPSAQTAAAAAQIPTPPPAPPVTPPVEQAKAGYKDGTYYGWGSCRHGDIQAAVIVEEGKIVTARVERCLTRYSCNWITPIPPRILAKQGTTYDYVSGATESSDAFQDAVAEALSQAK